MSEKKVYCIDADKCRDINADDILDMSDEEKQALIDKAGVPEQVHTIEGFFYYLNSDMIDTETCYWVIL